jgi:nucleoside-diphosphate-sugar epimerase
MKVFVAGAGGAIGRQLVPRLVADGHDVVGMIRSQAKRNLISDLGAQPVVADALDADAVTRAVSEAKPETIVHQLTSIPGAIDTRHIDRDFALTNRLRTEGTDNLLAAAKEVGARRFVAQSFAGWPYDSRGGGVKTEEDPLDPEPVAPLRGILEAIRHLESAVADADWIEGLVLRYGPFYGPGTSLSAGPDATMTEMVRKRRFPVVGDGAGVWSFIQIEDAAAATVAAVRGGPAGIYNIVDDDPAPVSEWLPALAEAIGAKPPMRVPRWLGRLGAGEAGMVLMTKAPGVSNEKAKRELNWQPRYPSWRQGFVEGLS